jgi:LysM repeat protein
VQPGDTLYDIAIRYGTTIPALVAANNISNPNNISVGSVLIIP